MYDLNRRICLKNVKVKDLIAALELENEDADFICDGLNEMFIHVAGDNSIVSLDISDLEDDYREDYESRDEEFPEEVSNESLVPQKQEYHIPRIRMMDLLLKMIDTYYGKEKPDIIRKDLKSLGFKEDELRELGYR